MLTPTAFDPPTSSPIVTAVLWLQGTLLGTVATTVAILCVAGVGYRALMGQLPVRRALTVILGCFILFGAPGIAAALRGLAASGQAAGPSEDPPAPTPFTGPSGQPARPAPNPFDPYGGG